MASRIGACRHAPYTVKTQLVQAIAGVI